MVPVIHSFLNGFRIEFPPTKAEFLVRSVHCISMILAVCGILYAWELLTPMLFEYLSNDAASWSFHPMETRSLRRFHFELVHSKCHWISSSCCHTACPTYRIGGTSNLSSLPQTHLVCSICHRRSFSPPDPLSLFLVSLPVIFLFETALLLHQIMPMKSTQPNSDDDWHMPRSVSTIEGMKSDPTVTSRPYCSASIQRRCLSSSE